MCNCIHELLNVFEGSAQREHTIVSLDIAVRLIVMVRSILFSLVRRMQHVSHKEQAHQL